MEKTKKIIGAISLVLLEIFLLTMIVFSVLNVIPKKWEIRQNTAISQVDNAGKINMVDVKYFAVPKIDGIASSVKGVKNINNVYITNLNANISAEYIRENGFTKNLQLEKTVQTKKDFCYKITGAENGAVWEVWITFTESGSPHATVIKSGGAEK